MRVSIPAGRLAGRIEAICRLLLWPFILLAIGTAALEFNAWTHEQHFDGPFSVEGTPGSPSPVVSIGKDLPANCCLEVRSDDNEHPFRSTLRLWVNGIEMGPSHAPHATIHERNTSGFSHWEEYVIFSLPPGVANNSEAHVVARYPVQVREPLAWLVIGTAMLLASWTYQRLFYRISNLRVLNYCAFLASHPHVGLLIDRCSPAASRILRGPAMILRALAYAALIASLLYTASTAYALLVGWALPTTALLHWSSVAEWAARKEPFAPFMVLTIVALGAMSAWVSPAFPRCAEAARRDELALIRFCRRWGLFISACAFVFSVSVMWSGIVRLGDFDTSAIGGLISFSDAHGYWAGAHDQAKDGIWNIITLRRPLAGAFRSTLLFFGAYSTSSMLLIQALLTSATAWFATWSVIRWRGVWAGTGFFALTYIAARAYVPTTLTEPLGLIWALFSVPFIVGCLWKRSLANGLVALGATTGALMVRPGSLFTIPAVIGWAAWNLRKTAKERLIAALLAILIVLASMSVNRSLQHAYGNGSDLTGSNFAYVLCGLSVGGNWTTCLDKSSSLSNDEATRTSFLYSLAWQNIKEDPAIFLRRIFSASGEFLHAIPDTLLLGYLNLEPVGPSHRWRMFLFTVAAIGTVYALVRLSGPGEIMFWLLLWASIVASAGVVFFDDGLRALVASYPLLCLFFTMGLAGPGTVTSPEKKSDRILGRSGGLILLAATSLFVFIPWLAHATYVSPLYDTRPARSNEALVFGGRRMTGFLVVADDAPIRPETPTVHWSQFVAMIERSGVERYQGLLHPEAPTLPFGFILAPRLEKGYPSYHHFIVPHDVLERREVQAWRFTLKSWNELADAKSGPYWYYVTLAEELP